jgi:hypothetical protein
MDSIPPNSGDDSTAAAPPRAGFGPLERCCFWIVTSGLTTAALAWIAVQVQGRGVAPAVLFPIVVGTLLGAVVEGLARLFGVRAGRSWLWAAGVWALLIFLAQDYIDYWQYQSSFGSLEQSNPKLALASGGESGLGPASFARFMQQTRLQQKLGWWLADAGLTLAAAVGWMLLRLRAAPPGGSSSMGRV